MDQKYRRFPHKNFLTLSKDKNNGKKELTAACFIHDVSE